MIAFACASTDERLYRGAARRAVELVAEADSLLMRRRAEDSVIDAYSEMLVEAAEYDDLEAVVLLDQSVSHLGAAFCGRIRNLLGASPDVAVVGAGSSKGTRESEAVEGPVAVLSPWAARTLSCDPVGEEAFEALALDLCFQARSHGRRVIVSSALDVATSERPSWASAESRSRVRAMAAVRSKWSRDPLDTGVSGCSH